MRKTTLFIGIIFIGLLVTQAFAQTAAEEKLFQEAKIFLFDEKWERAQETLDEFLSRYPDSLLAPQAVFYRAKCLGRKKGREKEALKAYQDYLQLKEKNRSLAEESEISIIDLAFNLYEKGEKSYLREIETRLESSNVNIKYYAAFKLSYLRDKKIAVQGIPVLKRIIQKEKDLELKERAKIALLRISPEALKDVETEREEGRVLALKIRVYVKGRKAPELSINIPWALADLALHAIPERDKAALRAEGYDLDKIVRELTRSKRGIEIESEDRIIKLWIE